MVRRVADEVDGRQAGRAMNDRPDPVASAPFRGVGAGIAQALPQRRKPFARQEAVEGHGIGRAEEIAADALGVLEDIGEVRRTDLVGHGIDLPQEVGVVLDAGGVPTAVAGLQADPPQGGVVGGRGAPQADGGAHCAATSRGAASIASVTLDSASAAAPCAQRRSPQAWTSIGGRALPDCRTRLSISASVSSA